MMTPSARSSIPLMEQSCQTDEERRLLRQKQRELQKKIQSNAEAMENPSLQVFSNFREENNTLFQQVFYTREAVLDGESLQMISEHAAKQIEGPDSPRYDAMRLTQKLRQKSLKQKFDWRAFGCQVGTCFHAIPSRIQFLKGPLHADYVPKRAVGKRKRVEFVDEGEEEHPDEVKNQETNSDRLSAVDRNIQVLNKVLKQRSEEVKQRLNCLPANKRLRQHCEVNAIQYMFNPHSFTQTVENLFHFSFLVKSGRAKIAARPDGPKVASISRSQEKEPTQAIVSLTMKDWRDLCSAYEVEQSDVPHRTGSKQVNHFKKSVHPITSETSGDETSSVEATNDESVETNDPANLKTKYDVSAEGNDDKSMEANNDEYMETNDDETPDISMTGPGGMYTFTDPKPREYLIEDTIQPGYPNDDSDISLDRNAANFDAVVDSSISFALFSGEHDEENDFVLTHSPTGSPTKFPVAVTPDSTPEPTTMSPSVSPTDICANTTIDFDTQPDDNFLASGELMEDRDLIDGMKMRASGGLGDFSAESSNEESAVKTIHDEAVETYKDESPNNSLNLKMSQVEETSHEESLETSLRKIAWNTFVAVARRPKVSAMYLTVWASVWVWVSVWNVIPQHCGITSTAGHVLLPFCISISIATVLTFFVWRLNALIQLLWSMVRDESVALK